MIGIPIRRADKVNRPRPFVSVILVIALLSGILGASRGFEWIGRHTVRVRVFVYDQHTVDRVYTNDTTQPPDLVDKLCFVGITCKEANPFKHIYTPIDSGQILGHPLSIQEDFNERYPRMHTYALLPPEDLLCGSLSGFKTY